MLPKVKTSFLSQVVVFWSEAAVVGNPLAELWNLQARRGWWRWGAKARESSTELAWGGGRTCCHFPKAGPASRRGEGQSGWSLWPAYPTPPFCLGVCPGSSEHRIYSKRCHQWKLSEGAKKRARGRGEDSRPPVPVLKPPPQPSLMGCFLLPFGKEGMP